MQHPDPDVQQAIANLSDALCSYERTTGIESVLIIRGEDGFSHRAYLASWWDSDIPDDISDHDVLSKIRLGWVLKSLPQDKRRIIAGTQ